MCETGRRNEAEEIVITPEMIEAGVSVLWNSGAVENPLDADRILIREIFVAMYVLELSRSCAFMNSVSVLTILRRRLMPLLPVRSTCCS